MSDLLSWQEIEALGHELRRAPLTDEVWCIKCGEENHVISATQIHCMSKRVFYDLHGNAVAEWDTQTNVITALRDCTINLTSENLMDTRAVREMEKDS